MKELGLPSVVATGVGLIVATSCLLSLGQGSGTIGITFILSMAIACLVNIFTALSLSELNALMPNLTAVENVAMPLTFQGVPRDIREKRAVKMLKMVGLGKFLDHRPGQMSGGQQQRVGIARALVVNPEIVFADEPTGNLDSNTTLEVLKLMQRIVHEKGQTMVMVTHDNYLASFGDKVIHIRDGKIIRVEEHPGGVIENVESLSADSLPGGTLAVPGGTLAKPVENSAAQYQQTVQPVQNMVQPAPADMIQGQQPWVQQPQAYTAQTAGPDIMQAQQMAVQTPQEYTVQPAAVTAPEYTAQNVMSGEIPGQQ